jgi:hypothetical protein
MHKAPWMAFIEGAYRQLSAMPAVPFATLLPSHVPEVAGVYLITAKIGGIEEAYYVGRSKNLRRRLYTNHLMGPVANARLKRYLISTGECADLKSAKSFIRANCHARWIVETDIRKRGAIEGYVTGVLFPKHGIYEEH